MAPKAIKRSAEEATSSSPKAAAAAAAASTSPAVKKSRAPKSKVPVENGATAAAAPEVSSSSPVAPKKRAAAPAKRKPAAAAAAAAPLPDVAAAAVVANGDADASSASPAASPVAKKRARAPAKKPKAAPVTADEDAADEAAAEVVVPAKKARITPKKKSAKNDDDDDIEEVIKPVASKSRSKKIGAPAAAAAAAAAPIAVQSEDDAPRKPPRRQRYRRPVAEKSSPARKSPVKKSVPTKQTNGAAAAEVSPAKPAKKARAKKDVPLLLAPVEAAETNGGSQAEDSPAKPKKARAKKETKPAASKPKKAPAKAAVSKTIVNLDVVASIEVPLIDAELAAEPQAAAKGKRPVAAAKSKPAKAAAAGSDDANGIDGATDDAKPTAAKKAKTAAAAKPKAAIKSPVAAKGRAKKPKPAAPTDNEANEEDEEPAAAAKPTLLNSISTDYAAHDFELAADMPYTLKVSSWNVAGLRAICKKEGMRFVDHQKPDIMCLQEIKCVTDEVPAEAKCKGYHQYWNAVPGGHAGVGLLTKVMPYNVHYGFEYDTKGQLKADGRLITAEYLKFFVVCVYVPNAGRGLVNLEERLRWNVRFQEHVLELNKTKPVIVCGDLNVSHKAIDLANPKTNTKSAGFTPEERAGMDDLLAAGFVDTFRHLYPERTGAYTYWTYLSKARLRNVGWRLDYFLASERLVDKVVDNVICSTVMGSDHCPITLFLNV